MRQWLETNLSLEWCAVIIFFAGSVITMAVCERLQRNRYRRINEARRIMETRRVIGHK